MPAFHPAPVDDALATRGGPTLVRAAAATVLLLSLQLAAGLLVPLAAALVLFLLMSAPAEALQRRGVPAVLVAALLVFAPACAIAALGVVLLPAVQAWWGAMPQRVASLGSMLAAAGAGPDLVAALRKGLANLLAGAGQDAPVGALGGRALALAFGTATASMLVFFLLLAQRSLLAALLGALPDRALRHRVLTAAHATRAGVATYFHTMLIVNAGVGAATGAVVFALGTPDATAWAVVTALLLFVPYLGPLAIALLLAAAGPHHGSGLQVLLPAAAFLALHAIEANFVSPMLMGWRLRIGRPSLIVAVMLGGWAWGVAGGVLAVPLLIAWRAALQAGDRSPLLLAALEAERADAPAIASPIVPVGAGAADQGADPAIGQVRQMPLRSSSTLSCTSPSSPKPIRPKSTGSP